MRNFDQPEGAPPPSLRRTVFPVAEGDVTLVFPDGMSKVSVSDLESYLKIWFGKAKRDAERE